MTSAVYTSSTGELVSVGTVVANPLPAGLTAVALTQADADGLASGAKRWNPSLPGVEATPGWVDPAISLTNRATIEQAITDALAQLDALIAATALPAIAAIPAIPAGASLTTTQLTTSLRSLSTWADTAMTGQRTANQATRAGAQQVAATLKRTIRLVRGDFTGTT